MDRFLSQETDVNTPITDMVVNSLLTSPRRASRSVRRAQVEVKGIAWDNGTGIRTVEVSADGGQSWQTAVLDPDSGRFAFRGFRHASRPGPRAS